MAGKLIARLPQGKARGSLARMVPFSAPLWRKYFVAIALVAAGAGPGAPLHAQEPPPAALRTDAPWSVGIVPSAEGRPAYCLAEAGYANGLNLLFALSPEEELNLGIEVPGAGFQTGDVWDLTFRIDETLIRTVPVSAVETDMLRQNFGKDAALLRALRAGRVLRLTGPMDASAFALTGTARALADLQDCADRLAGRVKTPPVARAAPAPAAASVEVPAPDLPPPLRGVLEQAGQKIVEVIDLSRLPPEQRPADFAWRTASVVGGVRERSVPPEETLEKIAAQILEAFKSRCAGAFTATPAAVETVGTVRVQTADLQCAAPDRPVHVALLFYRTDTNLFTMFMHEAPQAQATAAQAARDALAAVIKGVARSESAHRSGG